MVEILNQDKNITNKFKNHKTRLFMDFFLKKIEKVYFNSFGCLNMGREKNVT